MISPYLKNDGWKENMATKLRTTLLRTSLTFIKIYNRTKDKKYAQLAKECHDQADTYLKDCINLPE